MEHPQPEEKDWTWVLDRPCDQCGYRREAVARDTLAAGFRANAATWRDLLGRGPVVATRPPDDPARGPVWSALEYGAHVRDVYRLFAGRVEQMLLDDDPTFDDWDPDQAAIDGAYSSLEASTVAYELAVEAGRLADVVDRLHGDQWLRTGSRAGGASFTVESLLAYAYHDVRHHVVDVEAGYEALAEDE